MPKKKTDSKATSAKKIIKKGEKGEPPKIVETKCSQWLAYTFSAEEMQKMGKEIAYEFQQAGRAEEEKKMANAQFKDRIEKHTGAASRLSRDINQGYDMRDIPCMKTIDYTAGIVVINRIDTGEMVEERGIQDHEKQMKLPDASKGQLKEGETDDQTDQGEETPED